VNGLVQILPLIAIFLLIYLLMIRPNIRRNRDLAQLQGELKPGDRVMLTSGFFGTVRVVDEDQVNLELADGVVVSVARGAVARLLNPAPDGPPADPGQES
jgi:preprotein translocase subunit YajC